MARFANTRRVFFLEEPVFDEAPHYLEVAEKRPNLNVCIPHITAGTSPASFAAVISEQLRILLKERPAERYIAWFYTPMMLSLSDGLSPVATVYDCMDELSGFRGAPPELCEMERQLISRADLMFTGGHSLYEAKVPFHRAVYEFPSAVEVEHFEKALDMDEDAPDQAHIPHPRIGFAGVIDERTDLHLLESIARLKYDWNFIMLGPVVKIQETDLPQLPNIHYLGMKAYADLPLYLSEWDAAMMPFALNESTRFISPTKTPEFLAAGLPVVSTPITDVVRPYGDLGLVHIAATPEEFVTALKAAMDEMPEQRMVRVRNLLKENSWDRTFEAMSALIRNVVAKNAVRAAAAAV